MPGLSHFFGIKPWDLDRMTYGEIDMYLTELAAAIKAQGVNGA